MLTYKAESAGRTVIPMKFVIDSNVIFAALIQKSITRNIILSDIFVLYAPEQIFTEIVEHKELIRNKAKIGKRDFIALLMLLQRHVYLISDEKYHENLPLAETVA